MNRSQITVLIYSELRSKISDKFSSKELLLAAANLVEIIRGYGPITGARPQDPRPTFYELPVDEAILDGGWKLLSSAPAWFWDVDTNDTAGIGSRTRMSDCRMDVAV